jgi:hypothetical protein
MFKPDTRQIRVLKPNVTCERARDIFTRGSANLIAAFFRGPARSISELYIPYRFFQVRITNRGKEESRIFAVEAFRGAMDLYQFPAFPSEADLLTVETRNVLPSSLESSQAQDALMAQVRRLIFMRGFFALRDPQLEATPIAAEICIPYWICFRGRSPRAHISVLDAVRCRLEGSKARHLIEDWLRSPEAPSW